MTLFILAVTAFWVGALCYCRRQLGRAVKLNRDSCLAFQNATGMLLEAQRSQSEAERLYAEVMRMGHEDERQKFKRAYMVMN